jgi:hypothetical protein
MSSFAPAYVTDHVPSCSKNASRAICTQTFISNVTAMLLLLPLLPLRLLFLIWLSLFKVLIFITIICYYYGYAALCWALTAVSVSWSYTQSVGLFEVGISLSQSLYLHTGQHKHRINTHRHTCLRVGSEPTARIFERAKTSWPLWLAVISCNFTN